MTSFPAKSIGPSESLCEREYPMIECKELAGKVIRVCHLYENGSNGPEVHIEFTDDTTFFACLKTSVSLEAKCIQDEGGEPQVLKDYTSSAISR